MHETYSSTSDSVPSSTVLASRSVVSISVHLLVDRQQARIVARVVLHGHVEDELRIGVLVEQLKNLVVGSLVGHHAAQGIGALEIVDGQELVKTKVLVDVLAVPVGRVVGVHGRGGIAERFELLCQVPGRLHVVDGVGVHAEPRLAMELPVINSNSVLAVPPP